MAKNDNPHALRFLESMEKYEKTNQAKEFAEEYPLSKSAKIDKKFEWAQNVCEFLSDNYDDETIKKIRMDCACGPALSKGKKLKEIYEKETDIMMFVEKVNKLNQGFSIEYDGKYFYQIYPQCYCSCVKRIDKTLPMTWCYCTLGYTKKLFEYILGKEVQTELISSVKMGDANCRIRISI